MPALVATAFLVGLAGGVHCVAMCGGIVAALGLGAPQAVARPARAGLLRQLAYSLGRMATYTCAGAVAGGVGGLGIGAGGVLPVQVLLLVIANALDHSPRPAPGGTRQRRARLRTRRRRRLARRSGGSGRALAPASSGLRAVGVGLAWGFLPCGLVYSVLATALVSGSAARGALVMASFGLGTLPNLLAAGLAAEGLRRFVRKPRTRRIAGLAVVLLGVVGLARIPDLSGAPQARDCTFCTEPGAARRRPAATGAARWRRRRASSPTCRGPPPREARGRRPRAGPRGGCTRAPIRGSARGRAASGGRCAGPPQGTRDPCRGSTKSLASRESCGASTNDTEAPAAASVGASFRPSPTKRTRAPERSRARIHSSFDRDRHRPSRLGEAEGAREPLDGRRGVAGKNDGVADAGASKLLDDRVRAGSKLLGEREERRPAFAVGQNGREPAPLSRRGELPSVTAPGIGAATQGEVRRADPPARAPDRPRRRRRPGESSRVSARAERLPAAQPMARAAGCVEPASSAAAIASAASRSRPPAGSTDSRRGVSSVSVPVLSKTAVSARASRSIAARRAGSTPIAANRPAAIASAMGVARARAQGHVTMSTATVAGSARAGSWASHQAVVAAEKKRIEEDEPRGEAVGELDEARARPRGLSRRASGSPRAVESRAARVTRRRVGPPRSRLPATTGSPACRSRGQGSPVKHGLVEARPGP